MVEGELWVSASGTIAREKQSRWNPNLPFQLLSGLTGLLMQAVQAKQRAARIEAHELEAKTISDSKDRSDSAKARTMAHLRSAVRLRSTGGLGVHEWVSHCPSGVAAQLNDSEFDFAVRWRLGLPTQLAGECQLRAKAATEAERCGRQRDALGDHSLLCGKGRGRYRVHNAVVWCLSRFATQAGVEAEQEQVCPELLQGTPGASDCLEARLDLHLWGHTEAMLEAWVDVTLTHPFKRDARKTAAAEDGATVATAESKKRKRYGKGSNGVACAPFGLELWGRCGASALAVLERLCDQLCLRTGRPRHAALARGRAELGVAMYRALAATVACSTRCKPHEDEVDCAHLLEDPELDLDL